MIFVIKINHLKYINQWRYTAGNGWGCDDTGCGLGKGPQEEFHNCADVQIFAVPGQSTTSTSPTTTSVTTGTFPTPPPPETTTTEEVTLPAG